MHVLLVFQRINVEKRYVYPQTEPSVRTSLTCVLCTGVVVLQSEL